MAMVDIYSKRQSVLKGELTDVYEYDKLPHPFCA